MPPGRVALPPDPEQSARPLGWLSATSIVVASMIGSGIFFTTGYFSKQIVAPTDVILVWVVGGVLALAGALSYGELGAMMPEAGGEYHYISRIYGRLAGFLSGFVSLVAGFAAPIAGVAIFFAQTLRRLDLDLPERGMACGLIAVMTAVHGYGVRFGAAANDGAAILKVVLLVVFIVAGLFAPAAAASLDPEMSAPGPFSEPFALALVVVAFAYTGWNAAAYVGGELRRPQRVLPLALLAGTLGVTVLYVIINLVFLRALAPHDMGDAVGAVAAERLFGEEIGRVFNAGLAVVLLSTVSAFVMSGPRVTLAMARDGLAPKRFSRLNARGAPTAAVLLQGVVAVMLVLAYEKPDDLLRYIGILLSFFSGLAVFGVIVLRRRAPGAERPFRVPGYPFVPLAFVALAAWMIVVSVRGTRSLDPNESPPVASALTLIVGVSLYFVVRGRSRAS